MRIRGTVIINIVQVLVIPTVQSHFYPSLLWWKDHERMEGNISKMAYDLLSVPAMSAECERIFSSAGMMIVPKRNRFNDDIVGNFEGFKIIGN